MLLFVATHPRVGLSTCWLAGWLAWVSGVWCKRAILDSDLMDIFHLALAASDLEAVGWGWWSATRMAREREREREKERKNTHTHTHTHKRAARRAGAETTQTTPMCNQTYAALSLCRIDAIRYPLALYALITCACRWTHSSYQDQDNKTSQGCTRSLSTWPTLSAR